VTITPLAADRDVLLSRRDELADFFINSKVTVTEDDAAGEPGFHIERAPGERCARCWKRRETMSEPHDDLCQRCSDVVAAL